MSDAADHWILQFDSIHHVLAAEQALVERDIWNDMVPTPRDVNSDCGMVLQFRPTDWEQVSLAMSTLRQIPRGIYRCTEHGYVRLAQSE
jgi:hypothetical protein